MRFVLKEADSYDHLGFLAEREDRETERLSVGAYDDGGNGVRRWWTVLLHGGKGGGGVAERAVVVRQVGYR